MSATEPSGASTVDLDVTPLLEKTQQRLQPAWEGRTDRGKVRSTNEDSFLIAELRKAMCVRQTNLPQPEKHLGDERGYLFLVADGMGGHKAGEKASALAIDSIETFMLNTFQWFFHLRGAEHDTILEEFQDALREADHRLFAEAHAHPQWRGMGTTLTMAYVLNADLYVVHVGDSRAYLFHEGRLFRLTRDHNVAGELLEKGLLSQEEAATSGLRHLVTNVVGGNEPGLRVETHKLRLHTHDRLLLCTDGLTNMMSDGQIQAAFLKESDPVALCDHLVAYANAAGGKDNITAITIRFEPAGVRTS